MSDTPLRVGDQLEEIFADRRFVCWRWETRQGAKTKVPYEPGTGRTAATDNPTTWRTYEEACATLAKGNFDGIGYVVTQRDGFAALDLDHCRDPKSGDLEPWAVELIARADSYVEITPSGEGVRILGIASGVPDAHYQLPRGTNGQRVEVFYKATRYITLSEKSLNGSPRRLNDISAILADLAAERDSKKNWKSAGGGPQPSDSGLVDDTAELIRQIMAGESYHPALIPLAARMIGSGTFPGAVVNFLRSLMEQIPLERRDERWRARYADIPRIVETAEVKFSPAHVQSDWPKPLDIIGGSAMIGWGELSRECLPQLLLDYVEAEAERLDVDLCPVALHVLAAAASSISDAWSIKMKLHDAKWLEQARLWSCVIKDVGGRGTAVLKAAFWPIYRRDGRLRHEHARALAAWKTRKEQAGKNFDEKSDPEPVEVRLYSTDPTVEALSDILEGAGEYSKLALIQDELAGLFGGFGRYSGQGGAERAAFLKAYDGGPEHIDRVKRGHIFVPNWSLVIVGNIQPRKLARLGTDLIDDGLFQRFLTIHAKPSPGREDDDRRMNPMIGARYGDLIDILSAMVPSKDQGGVTPVYVPVEAQDERKRFAQFLNTLRRNETLPVVVRETASKWSGLHARLTLIFHLVGLASQQQDGASLTPRDTYAADLRSVAMAARFLEAVALPNLLKLGFDTLHDKNDAQAHARTLAGLILARGLDSISASSVGRIYRPLRGVMKETGAVMDVLTAAGWAREKSSARHDNHTWEINPEVHVRFAAQAAAERGRSEEIRQLLKKRR